MSQVKQKLPISFIALMAFLMAMTIFAVEAILPGLSMISTALDITKPADTQYIILALFLGLGIGPLFFGPLSDAYGRKPAIMSGLGLFIVSSVICVTTQSFEVMIVGRIFQGIGLSAPRTMSVSLIRDKYDGDYMARMISYTMVVFIMFPVIAPIIGKSILDHYQWQFLFYLQILLGKIILLWFYFQQEETLLKENRVPFSALKIVQGFRQTFNFSKTVGYTVILGLITGSYLVFIGASQHIFEIQYMLKDQFPYIFAGLTLVIGVAMLVNGSLVLRYGAEKMIVASLFGYFVFAIVYLLLFSQMNNPSIYVLIIFFALQFFCAGVLFGNLFAAALQPVGNIAGIGAAVTEFISTLIAVAISIYIGRYIDTSVIPLFIGFAICSLISLFIYYFIKKPQAKTDLRY